MKNRKLKPELMDDPSLDEVSLKQALQDVTLVNRWLGGKEITIKGIRYFFKKYQQSHYKIVDLGCGDGEMLRYIAKYTRKHNIKVKLIGMDLNSKSIQIARERSVNYPEIEYIQQDILTLNKDTFNCDIIVSTLTMHHFKNSEIELFLKRFYDLAGLGFVINDLHRSFIAYYLFHAFSRIFMKTYIARHDGLISIERAF
ncbi:MAG: methyltransferase domain-containing protein, partial [Leeuwenhoekiella sp.]